MNTLKGLKRRAEETAVVSFLELFVTVVSMDTVVTLFPTTVETERCKVQK